MPPRRPSLRARGIQLLAQREHSRSELRTKLLRHARADAAADALAAPPDDLAGDPASDLASDPPDGTPDNPPPPDTPAPPDTPEAAVERTLDWLQAHHYLDDTRFVESRIHARAARFGAARIRQELARHGVAIPPDAAAALKASERERARAVWQRKFGVPPVDAADRARQMRFLAGRGFAPDTIRRVVGGDDDDMA